MASLLVIGFFPAFEPTASGGEQRLSRLYRAVSQTHDVTLLTSTDVGARYEEIQHTARFRELRFPKDEHWRQAYATLDRVGVKGELSGLAFALAVSDPECLLSRRARGLAAKSAFVVHEFPYSEPIFSDGCPCPEIYNAHNVEASLLGSIVTGSGFDRVLLRLLKLEGNLVARAQRVFATSAEDLDKFRLFYGAPPAKLGLCPNGFDPEDLAPVVLNRGAPAASPGRPRLLFLGSAHAPNVEAARFLIGLAAELPECDLILAGGVCAALGAVTVPANLQLVGAVDARTRIRLLSEADLSVNPVISGSGTSLKALDALGCELPMVSTPEGVRGLKLIAGSHCEVTARDGFATSIRRLLADPDRRRSLASAGRTHVTATLSWQAIGAHWAASLETPPISASSARPQVLALNDYSVLGLRSGGAARIRALLTQLDCDVVLVTFGPAFELEFIGAGVLAVTVPRTAAHLAFESALNSGQPVSAYDVAASLFAAANPVLRTVVADLASRSRAVIFEHPYLAPLLDVLAVTAPDLPVIYSAHNVEAEYKKPLQAGHSSSSTLLACTAALESRLVAAATLVVCCTDEDARALGTASAEALVVPNGCDVPPPAPSKTDATLKAPARVGFMGSSHPPNVTAANYIREVLAPAFPDVQFELLGDVCRILSGSLPTNLVTHGAVDDSDKSEILRTWDLALNPVATGGGSSLKLADYLAHGLATLNTPTGVRGFLIAARDCGRIAPLEHFPSALAALLADTAERRALAERARAYAVESLSWSAVTDSYRRRLRELIEAGAPGRPSTRLLVVSCHYTEPAVGDAEQYLTEVLTRLRPRLGRLDLAAIDIGYLTNHAHFACQFEPWVGGGSRRLAELFDQTRFFPADVVPRELRLESARRLEREWCREEFSLLSRFMADLAHPAAPRVFSGFFIPERIDGALRRWSAPEFSFLLPARSQLFEMQGFAPVPTSIEATVRVASTDGNGEVLCRSRHRLSGRFDYRLKLPAAPAGEALIVHFEVVLYTAIDDHRPLGVLLAAAAVLLPTSATRSSAPDAALDISRVDLTEIHEDELRVSRLEEWMRALRDTAATRPAAMEEAFAQLRGPHSAALQSWLEAHAGDYDTILVQGIPFDLIPRTMETLSRLPQRPRVVALPHFHGDDRFYHWRRYAQALAAADATLLFSTSIAQALDPAIKAIVVPGGGVRPEEHADLEAEPSFRRIHNRVEPYFLVLGRKVGSKGYDRVILAHQRLRREGLRIGLVLVGPDEDKLAVSGEGVYALGQQPRGVVIGAVRGCLGVVTMSHSESFGIVLCEAWLFGKPVIANAACYAFRERVAHGSNGLLVTTDDELVAAMRTLAEDPDERHRLGASGFREVLSTFTWENVAEAVFKAIVPHTRDASPTPSRATPRVALELAPEDTLAP